MEAQDTDPVTPNSDFPPDEERVAGFVWQWFQSIELNLATYRLAEWSKKRRKAIQRELIDVLRTAFCELVINRLAIYDDGDNKVRYHYGCLLAGLDTSITRLAGQVLFEWFGRKFSQFEDPQAWVNSSQAHGSTNMMALFFMAASDRNLANTIRSALIAQAKETGGLLYNDFKEARNSYNMASRIGRSASQSVVVGFVDPQSDERAREITGKFAFDASVTCEQIQSQADELYAVTDPYRVRPIEPVNTPQTHIILDREKVSGLPLATLPEGVFLSESELKILDLKTIHAHPAFVFAQIHTAPARDATELMRKMSQGIDLSSKNRLGFRRGVHRQQYGLGAGVGERLSQQGEHGIYHNFVNGARSDLNKVESILVADERAIDYLDGILRGVLPGLSDLWYNQARDSRLAPRGARGYSITGATTQGYMSPQHNEVPSSDPNHSAGINSYRGDNISGNGYYFCLGAAHGGRGILAENSFGTLMIWPGIKFTHGTIVGHDSWRLIRQEGTTESDWRRQLRELPLEFKSLGIAVYQKQGPLRYGIRHLVGQPPKTFRMAMTQLEDEQISGSLGWIGASDMALRRFTADEVLDNPDTD